MAAAPSAVTITAARPARRSSVVIPAAAGAIAASMTPILSGRVAGPLRGARVRPDKEACKVRASR